MISGFHSAAGEDYEGNDVLLIGNYKDRMEAACSSETYVLIYQVTWCHIPEDCSIL